MRCAEHKLHFRRAEWVSVLLKARFKNGSSAATYLHLFTTDKMFQYVSRWPFFILGGGDFFYYSVSVYDCVTITFTLVIYLRSIYINSLIPWGHAVVELLFWNKTLCFMSWNKHILLFLATQPWRVKGWIIFSPLLAMCEPLLYIQRLSVRPSLCNGPT
jgi:hypothetical protein